LIKIKEKNQFQLEK